MGKVHHSTLKAAVAKYSPLHAEGKTADEVKAAIAEDEKEFDSNAVEEIYAVIAGDRSSKSGAAENDQQKESQNEKPTAKKGKYAVKSEFRDIKDFSLVHAVGSDVSHFDEKRLETLVANGLVEKK